MAIKDLLKSKGVTVGEIAEQTTINPVTLYRYAAQKDASKIPLSAAAQIAKALNMDVQEFWEIIQVENPERAADITFTEGWNELGDMDILIENGIIVRGIRGNKTVYPYLAVEDGFSRTETATIADIGKVSFF